MAEPRNYTEYLILGEIERAIEDGNDAALAPLARIAGEIGLSVPERVKLRLRIRDTLSEKAA